MKVIIVLVTFLYGIYSDDFENTKGLCSRCDCNYSKNNESLRLDCSERHITKTLANWPDEKAKIEAIFTNNQINRLDALPSSGATSLKVVYDHCGIHELGPGLFESCVNIEYVDLSHNEIPSEQLTSDVFKGPYNETIFEPIGLRHLNLAYNKLHTFSKNIFEHTPYLEVLILEGNGFEVVDIPTTLAIGNLRNLKILNLANNKLSNIPMGLTQNLKSLSKLDLSKNRLDFVPDAVKLAGHSLNFLILDHNPIIEFEDQTFLGLVNLTYLSANHLSELRIIKTNSFAPLDKLEKLDMSYNYKLGEIEDEAFGKIANLREMNISHNNLTSLPPHLINWSELEVLDLRENPLYCNCDLFNITSMLSEKVEAGEDPMCWDVRKPVRVELYNLKSDICSLKWVHSRMSEMNYFTSFRIMRMSLVVLSIVLLVCLFVATWVLCTRWNRFRRTRGYPFASQVIYNPIMEQRL